MESRMLDYRQMGGGVALEYHPTPLIGEMANTFVADYHHHPNHLYRSIDTLRILNERGQLFPIQQPHTSPTAPHPVRTQLDKIASFENIGHEPAIYQNNQSDIASHAGSASLSNVYECNSLHVKNVDEATSLAASLEAETDEVDIKDIAKAEMEAVGRSSSSSSPITIGTARGADSTTVTMLDPNIFIKQEDSATGFKVFCSRRESLI